MFTRCGSVFYLTWVYELHLICMMLLSSLPHFWLLAGKDFMSVFMMQRDSSWSERRQWSKAEGKSYSQGHNSLSMRGESETKSRRSAISFNMNLLMYTLMETHVVAIKPRKVHGKNRKAVCINLNLQIKQIWVVLYSQTILTCVCSTHMC